VARLYNLKTTDDDKRNPRLGLPELVREVADRFDVDPKHLRAISRRRHYSFVRAVIAWYATNAGIATLTEVARYFHRVPSTLSVAVIRYQREKPEFFVESLDDFLKTMAPPAASSGAG
jgi:chromosomal replication initiation ATPase DnaA